MRKQLFAALLALIVCGTAVADMQINIGISGGDWPSAPYVITPVSGTPAWMTPFETFCVESSVPFTPGNYAATIDDDILYAGGSTPVTLNDNVKKVYAAFLNNELGGFTGNEIQESVWGAQGYSGHSLDAAIAGIIGNASAIVGWDAVKVLNLWGPEGQDVQSQLVLVPVPGAALLGALGIGFAATRLRRRRLTADS